MPDARTTSQKIKKLEAYLGRPLTQEEIKHLRMPHLDPAQDADATLDQKDDSNDVTLS